MATQTRGRMGATSSSPNPGHTQGAVGGRDVLLGDEVYLWLLVVVEVLFVAYFRSTLSRYHGG